jgi:hypothetical protein
VAKRKNMVRLYIASDGPNYTPTSNMQLGFEFTVGERRRALISMLGAVSTAATHWGLRDEFDKALAQMAHPPASSPGDAAPSQTGGHQC